jgi:hypothetical protein
MQDQVLRCIAVVKHQQLLRSCCLRSKNGRSPPAQMDECLRSRKVPTRLHAQTWHNPHGNRKHAAHPAQMPKLRKTHEFPEIVCIGRYTPICWIIMSPSTQPDLPQPGLEAANADQRPASPSPPRAETANRKRQTAPVPGRGGPSAAGTRARRDRSQPVIVIALVRAGSAATENPWSAPGISGHHRRTRPQVTRHSPLRPRTAKQQSPPPAP